MSKKDLTPYTGAAVVTPLQSSHKKKPGSQQASDDGNVKKLQGTASSDNSHDNQSKSSDEEESCDCEDCAYGLLTIAYCVYCVCSIDD